MALSRNLRHDNRVHLMAFLPYLDVLLRFASLIVEPCHPLGGTGQVVDDEADTGMQFTGMPFYLGHHAPLPVPASGLIAEAGIEAQYMVRRAANGSREQMADTFPKNPIPW